MAALSLPARFARLAGAVSAKVGGPYLAAEIVRDIAGTEDDGGSIVTPGGVDRAPCKVQIDAISEQARPEGWTSKDYRFLLLSASIGSGSLSDAAPAIDGDIRVSVLAGPSDFQGMWLVSGLQRDPVAIGWAGKGRRSE